MTATAKGSTVIATATTTAVALAALALGAGCAEDFDPYNRLNSLRILAVRSEPAMPQAGQPAELSALVFTPPTDPSPVTYAWSWCPVPAPSGAGSGSTTPCLVSAEALAAMAPGVTLPPTDLGAGATAPFLHDVTPEQVAALCAMTSFIDCANGLPVQIRLTITNASDRVDAVFTMRLPRAGASLANANPRLDGLAIERAGVEQPIADDAQVTIPRDEETPLRAIIPAEVIESYVDTVEPTKTIPEHLFLTWFVESGDTSDTRTSAADDQLTVAQALERLRRNAWTPAKVADYAADTARLIVVIHDNRGGVGWATAAVRLEGTP